MARSTGLAKEQQRTLARLKPVAALEILTVTPGSTAFEASTTRPVICPDVACDCPYANPATSEHPSTNDNRRVVTGSLLTS